MRIFAVVRELDPTTIQAKRLGAWCRTVKSVHNWALDQQKDLYDTVWLRQMVCEEKVRGKYSPVNLVKIWQNERDTREAQGNVWWADPPAQIFGSKLGVMGRVESAYKNFFEGRADFPNYKGRRDRDSIPLPTHGQTFRIGHRSVWVQKMGDVRLKESMPLDFRAKTGSIYSQANRWFVSVIGERYIEQPIKTGDKVLGIDRGVKVLAMRSDGVAIENPKARADTEAKRARLQRKLSRQEKGSARRRDTILQLQRLNMYESNVRKNALHNASIRIARDADVVVLETLNVKGMMAKGGSRKRGLNRALADASMGELGRQTRYKTPWQGGVVVDHPMFRRSTQRCSRCDASLNVTSKERTFHCPTCGLVMDRDLNAAKCLQSWGEKVLTVSTGPAAHSGPIETAPEGAGSAQERVVHSAQAEGDLR